MLTRVKTFLADGSNPNGRVFAGDLNGIQDAAAAQTDFAQTISALALSIGEAGLQLVRFGSGDARITGMLRCDGILRGLGGIYAGAFTTTQRDAIASGSRPYGLIILNTTNNRLEWNMGSDATPNWQSIGWLPANGVTIANADVSATAAIAYSKLNLAGLIANSDLAGSIAQTKLVPLTINQQTAGYTLVLGDQLNLVQMASASAIALTVPPNSSVAFPVGTVITVVSGNTGTVTITPGSGVTLRAYNSGLKLAGQWAMCSLVKKATDEWYVAGNLVP